MRPQPAKPARRTCCRTAPGWWSRSSSSRPEGVDHIVEVAFAANIEADQALLCLGGSIATYASNADRPAIPFWPLVFNNIRLYFLGSDDFPIEAKVAATQDINRGASPRAGRASQSANKSRWRTSPARTSSPSIPPVRDASS